jgi:hypothetical protein
MAASEVGYLLTLRDGEVLALKDGADELDGAGGVLAGVRDGVGAVAVVVVCGCLDGVVSPFVAVVGADADAAGDVSSGHVREHELRFLVCCGERTEVNI